MGHDASKVLLGSSGSSDKEVSCFPSDPATFLAGLAVRQKSDGGLSLSSGDGQLVGVSMGRSLSDTKKTAVARVGNLVPLRASEGIAVGTVTITNYANLIEGGEFDTITVGDVEFVAQAGAATLGTATFRAATGNTETAASLVAQINSHEDLEELVLASNVGAIVTITALAKGEDGNLVLEYSDEDTGAATVGATVSGSGFMEGGLRLSDYAAVGAPVIVSNSTGKAAASGTTTGAIYASDELAGVDPIDASEVAVALIDMGGGL